MGRVAGRDETWDLSQFTAGERAVYRAWKACLADGWEPNTVDLQRLTGYANSNVGVFVRMLVACGLIERTRRIVEEPEYRPDDPSPAWIAYEARRIREGWAPPPRRPGRRPTTGRQWCRLYLREWRRERVAG